MSVGAIVPVAHNPHFLDDVVRSIGWVDKVVVMEADYTQYDDQSEVRNSAIEECDTDYIFVLDADEILLESDARVLLSDAKKYSELTFGIPVVTYIGGLHNTIDYDSGHHPIVLVKRGAKLHDTRCCHSSFRKMNCAKLHHLKFLQPWSYIAWRTKHKHEHRMIHKVLPTTVNEELQKAVKSKIYDNTERVQYGENF